MGYFDDQDRDDKRAYKKMVVYFVAAASLVMLLFLVVIYMNTAEKSKEEKRRLREEAKEMAEIEEEKAEEEALGIGKNNLRSEDLDFWDMYEEDENDRKEDDKEDSKEDDTLSGNELIKKDDRKRVYDEDNEDKIEGEISANIVSRNEYDDENHIKAYDLNGDEKWYAISETAAKNNYDFKGNLSTTTSNNEIFYNDRKVKSALGIDVSKYQGTIDWKKVKESGIEFAMIRLGSRGYGSGQLILDDNFVTNITGAKEAGVKVGVYFYSQAVSVEEAVEEANFTAGALLNYGVTYPVVCDVEWVENDTARTDKLTSKERTEYVCKFCETIKTFGYVPMIYATKDMLIAGLDVDRIDDYDVWLQDDCVEGVGTDYPYQFTMWQYSQKGTVNGVSGAVDMDLCFVNYEER